MSKGKLVAHADTRRVTEAVVRAEPRPAFTSTWHPFSNAEVLDVLGGACKKMNLQVIDRQYSIRPGAKMFGLWELKQGTTDLNFCLGVRNSINKSMAVGLCAGEHVFICDNLVFSGDFVLFRKHTGRLSSGELEMMAVEAVEMVVGQFKALAGWHDGLREIKLNSWQASMLLVAAMRKEIVPPSRFRQWNDLYFGAGTKYTPTMHGWHGATTELMKDLSLLSVHGRNVELNDFINFTAPLLLGEVTIAPKKAGTGLATIEARSAAAAEEAAAQCRIKNKEAMADTTKEARRLKRRERRAEKKAAAKDKAQAA